MIDVGGMLMKTLFRYVPAFLAGLLFSVTVTAAEADATPVGDRDAFENNYIACIMSGLQDNCFITVFSGRFFAPPGEGAKQIYDAIKTKMQGVRVRKVHIVGKGVKASVVDVRTYLLELDNDQGFIGFYVVFRKRADNWYVYEFALDRSEVFIREIMGIPTPPPEAPQQK
jgi:hypothetical protein